VAEFAYGDGAHREALSKGSEWFQRREWPPSVAWWVPAGHGPSWEDAAERIDHLHEHGPTPRAFNLRKAFDADGNPTKSQQGASSQRSPAR
jgi:hypothetical protein